VISFLSYECNVASRTAEQPKGDLGRYILHRKIELRNDNKITWDGYTVIGNGASDAKHLLKPDSKGAETVLVDLADEVWRFTRPYAEVRKRVKEFYDAQNEPMGDDRIDEMLANLVWINDLKRLSHKFKTIFDAEPDFSQIIFPNGIPSTEDEELQKERASQQRSAVGSTDDATYATLSQYAPPPRSPRYSTSLLTCNLYTSLRIFQGQELAAKSRMIFVPIS
jgi:hypothetical protein